MDPSSIWSGIDDANGGYIVATGTPKEVSKNKKSYTGKYLRKYFE